MGIKLVWSIKEMRGTYSNGNGKHSIILGLSNYTYIYIFNFVIFSEAFLRLLFLLSQLGRLEGYEIV